MALGFDKLIERLLEDVALSGSHGVGDDELTEAVNTFYNARNRDARPSVSDEQQQDLLFSDVPPVTDKTVVDDALIDTVWDWLSKHPECEVIDTPQDFSSPALITTADGISTPPPQSHVEHPVPISKHAGKRIVTTEERVWQAVAGHGVDFNRIPRLHFQCLQVIAAHGPTGVLQPELTRVTGQDKRSLPKRTDHLAENGYITKVAVLADRARTSLLKLKKYAQAQSEDVNESNSTPAKRDGVPGKPLIFYDDWFDQMVELLKSHPNNLVTFKDVRLELGIEGKIYHTRALQRCVRRLAAAGCLQRLSAPVVDESGKPTNQLMRCLKLVREPTEVDRVTFKVVDKRCSKSRKTDKDLEQADTGPDGHGPPSEGDDALDELDQKDDLDHLQDRVPPQWTPDKPLTNLIFEIVDNAGPQGISSMDLSTRLVGPHWRRCLDESMARLTDAWQSSQPPHLRHLTLVRDTGVHNKAAHYNFRSLENFRQAVENGAAVWEAVTSGASPGSNGKGKAATFLQPPGLDQWGFPKLDQKRFGDQDGRATLVECRKAVGFEQHVPGNAQATSSESLPNELANRVITTPPPSGRSKSGRKSGRKADANKGLPSLPDSVCTPVIRKRERDVSRRDWEEFAHWAHVTAERLAKVELVRHQERASKRRRRNPAKSSGCNDQLEVEVSADRVPTIEAALMAKSRAGVYINPPGARAAKIDALAQTNKQPEACIAVCKTARLSELSWFLDYSPSSTPGQGGAPSTSAGKKRKHSSHNADGEDYTDERDEIEAISAEDTTIAAADSKATSFGPSSTQRTASVSTSEEASMLDADQRPARILSPSIESGKPRKGRRAKRQHLSAQAGRAPISAPTLSTLHSYSPVKQSQDLAATLPMPKKRGRPSKAMLVERERLQKETEAGEMPILTVKLKFPCTPSNARAPAVQFETRSNVDMVAVNYENEAAVDQRAQDSPAQDSGKDVGVSALQATSKPRSSPLLQPTPSANTGATSTSVAEEEDPNKQMPRTMPALAMLRPYNEAENNGTQGNGLRERHFGFSPVVVADAGDAIQRYRLSLTTPDQRCVDTLADADLEIMDAECVSVDATASSVAPSTKAVVSPRANKNQRRSGTTVDRGVIYHHRTRIVMDTMQQCGGVYPGNREMWYPFVTAWQKLYGPQPDRHTVDRAVKRLVDNGKLVKLGFSFKTSKGATKITHVLTLPRIDPQSDAVKACLNGIKERYPASYIPPEADVTEELRRRSASHPIPTGRKATDSSWRKEDGEIIYTPPHHYSRDDFPLMGGVAVKRTTAGLDAADREAQRHEIEVGSSRKRAQNKADLMEHGHTRRRPGRPRKTSESNLGYNPDPDPNGTDEEEVTEEQVAMQKEFQIERYKFNPDSAKIERRNNRGRLSRLLRFHDSKDTYLCDSPGTPQVHAVPPPIEFEAISLPEIPYLPSVKAHSTLNSEWLFDFTPGDYTLLVEAQLEYTMPLEMRTLLMRPGMQTLAASGTTNTSNILRLNPRKDCAMETPPHTQESHNTVECKIPPSQSRSTPKLQTSMAKQVTSFETLSRRLADAIRRDSGTASLSKTATSKARGPSQSMPETLDEILAQSADLGHVAASSNKGARYRFDREIDRVNMWEIDRARNGLSDNDPIFDWRFINHGLNQPHPVPYVDADHVAFERAQLAFAAKTSFKNDKIPVAHGLNFELSRQSAALSTLPKPVAPTPKASGRDRAQIAATLKPSRKEKAEYEPYRERKPWSSIEDAVLVELFSDPEYWKRKEEERAADFSSYTGTPRTWKALFQHYRMYFGNIPVPAQFKDAVPNTLRSSAPPSSVRIVSTSTASALSDIEAAQLPTSVLPRKRRQGRPLNRPTVPRRSDVEPSPAASNTAQNETSKRQPELRADGTPIDDPDPRTLDGVAERPRRTYRSRKRKLPVEEDDSSGFEYAETATVKKRPARRTKTSKRTGGRSRWSSHEYDVLLIAGALVLTLCGGIKPANPNWDLLAHAMSFRHDYTTLKSRWKWQSKAKASRLQNLQDVIRERVLSAYESGELLTIDFQDLQKTDWPALVEWVERDIVPQEDKPQRQESVADAVPDLLVSRPTFESQYSLLEPAELFGPSREAYFTSITDLLRITTALKLPHGSALPPATPPSVADESMMTAKSWFRAVVMAKESSYDARAASIKMSALSGSFIQDAQNQLVNDKIVVQARKDRIVPGRNFMIHNSLWKQFQRWPKPDVTYLRSVAAARAAIMTHFAREDRLTLDYRSEDPDVVVLSNMAAQDLVKVTTELPARNDDFAAPWPKLSAWGYTDFDYDTRSLDRSRLRFPVAYERTAAFTFEHGLSAVDIPTRLLSKGKADYRIPFWVDIHGNLLDDVWDLVLRSVLHLVVFRPGSSLKTMEEAHEGKLWAWEIEMALDWMEKTGLALRFGAGETMDGVWQGGWRASEWWYCAFAPEIARWKAPPPPSSVEIAGDRRVTRATAASQAL